MGLDDAIRLFLPEFLTYTQQSKLMSELAKFPSDGMEYFWDSGSMAESAMQGDAFDRVLMRQPETGDEAEFSVLMVSNTCDVDPANPRWLPPFVLIAPLIDIGRLRDHFLASGINEDRIDSHVVALRSQKITNAVFFPSSISFPDGAVAYLDKICSVPVERVLEALPARIWRLSQGGFYCFLLKLSIHFTRMGEQVVRMDEA